MITILAIRTSENVRQLVQECLNYILIQVVIYQLISHFMIFASNFYFSSIHPHDFLIPFQFIAELKIKV